MARGENPQVRVPIVFIPSLKVLIALYRRDPGRSLRIIKQAATDAAHELKEVAIEEISAEEAAA